MQTSPLFSLDFKDLSKGLLIAILSAVIAAIEASLATGSFAFNWKNIGGVALAAGLSYLSKNFFTPAKTIVCHK